MPEVQIRSKIIIPSQYHTTTEIWKQQWNEISNSNNDRSFSSLR